MKNERELHGAIHDGQQADAILKNGIIQAFFETERENIMLELESSGWMQRRKREELCRRLKTLRRFEESLMSTIKNGQKAMILLETQQKGIKYANR